MIVRGVRLPLGAMLGFYGVGSNIIRSEGIEWKDRDCRILSIVDNVDNRLVSLLGLRNKMAGDTGSWSFCQLPPSVNCWLIV